MAQTTLFAFGLKKFVQHNGVKHEVVPAPVLNYDIQNPLVCKFKCGQRFSRGCARASHERTCKRRKVPPPVVALAPGPVAAGASSDVEMVEQPPNSLELVAPAPQLVEQPPDSLEVHRRKAGAPPARVAVKKGRGLGKGSAHRRRYTTAEKRKILQ